MKNLKNDWKRKKRMKNNKQIVEAKRILFFGTDDISSIAINTLIEINANIVGVVTKPDKESGRKKQIIYSEIKQIALANNFKLFQPHKLSEAANEILNEIKPDLIITCSYGKIIPSIILNYPKYKCINIHPSLLPKYRGASPIQYAILNHDKVTGVTLMYMIEEMDAGDILFQEKINIDPIETTYSLREKVKIKISEMLKKHFHEFFGEMKTIKQDEKLITFTNVIKSNDEIINWNKNAIDVAAKIRALYDKPIARTKYLNKIIKIYEALVIRNNDNAKPGEILAINKDGILTKCGIDAILIKTIQIEGKKQTSIKNLLNGNIIFKVGNCFI